MVATAPVTWVFVTDCIHAEGDDINAMKEVAIELTYWTLRKKLGAAMVQREAELMYDTGRTRTHGLRLSKDWAVSYYRSIYRGRPCYFFVWSGIDQIFCERT